MTKMTMFIIIIPIIILLLIIIIPVVYLMFSFVWFNKTEVLNSADEDRPT